MKLFILTQDCVIPNKVMICPISSNCLAILDKPFEYTLCAHVHGNIAVCVDKEHIEELVVEFNKLYNCKCSPILIEKFN